MPDNDRLWAIGQLVQYGLLLVAGVTIFSLLVALALRLALAIFTAVFGGAA